MTKEETDKIYKIIKGFPPIKERNPPFKRPREMTLEESYSWLVNDWMPSQPDFQQLAKLTILLEFNMSLVVAALMGEERFETELFKLAEKRDGK